MIPEGVSIAYESTSRRACADRMLVLTSLSIPNEIADTGHGFAILVPEPEAERAKFELWQYEQENPPPAPPRPAAAVAEHNALPGVAGYVLAISVVAWLAAYGAFGIDWLGAGRVDGELVRDGQWWRTFTALTLHGSFGHLLGNIVFGILFGLLAGRVVGSGVAWFAIVLSAAAGNGLNTVLLESSHRSIGASTAVFAALGLVSGFVWRGRLMAQDRWPYRLGPIVGGIALLAFTGTGDENTDIGAHLAGFACGLGAGVVLARASFAFGGARLQWLCGAAAASLVAAAWWLGLRHWP